MIHFSVLTIYNPLLILLGSTWYNLLRGVLEVAGGTIAGTLLGFLIQYFPSVDQVGRSLQQHNRSSQSRHQSRFSVNQHGQLSLCM